MLRDHERNKDNWHYRIHNETKMEMGRTYIRMKDNRWTKHCAHRVATKEREEDDQAQNGKTTQQGRREPPGTGKQQTEDNGRH